MSIDCMNHSKIREFHAWVDSNFVQGCRSGSMGVGPDPDSRFIPYPCLQQYFTTTRVRDLLTAIYPDGVRPLASAIKGIPGYERVFAILLHINQGALINHFVRHDALSDEHLHLDINLRPASFPVGSGVDEDLYKIFCAHQHKFYNPKLSVKHDRNFDPEVILPFRVLEILGQGYSASIYKIKIYDGYNKLANSSTQQAQDDPFHDIFAVKQYYVADAEQLYTQELKAFQILGPDTRRKNNFIGFYGSFLQSNTFNIILEFADQGTLEEYFFRNEPPEGEQLFDFWAAIFELLSAVNGLHETWTRHSGTGSSLQGVHQDIKPENILVCSRDSEGSIYRCRFKLADLALCRFKSPGELTRGMATSHTYGAPESFACEVPIPRSVSTKVDIWSLGCVLSEAATWAVKGWKGILKYTEKRQIALEALEGFAGQDCFHNGEEALSVVTEHHTYLSRATSKTDMLTEKIVVLIDDMLVSEGSRAHAAFYYQKAKRLLDLKLVTSPSLAPKDSHKDLTEGHGDPQMTASGVRKDTMNSVRSVSVSHGAGRHRSSSPTAADVTRYESFGSPGSSTAVGHTGGAHRPGSDGSITQVPAHDSLCLLLNNESQSPPSSNTFNLSQISRVLPQGHGIVEEPTHDDHPRRVGSSTIPNAPPTSSFREPPSAPFSQYVAPKPSVLPAISVARAMDWMHRRNKSELLKPAQKVILSNRDFLILLDDSGSMSPHWDEVVNLVRLLTKILKAHDKNGLDLHFASHTRVHANVKTSTEMDSLALMGAPRSTNHAIDVGGRLSDLLNVNQIPRSDHKRSGSLSDKFFGSKEKGKILYIFTNGKWEDDSDAEPSIRRIEKALGDREKPDFFWGIQFIYFGRSERGVTGWDKLVHYDDMERPKGGRDIVDTEPANGDVLKMLIGSVNKTYDNSKRR